MSDKYCATVCKCFHVGESEYKDVCFSKIINDETTVGKITEWAKTIDPKYGFMHVKFSYIED